MDRQYFAHLWGEGKTSRASGKWFWNNRAEEFNKLVSQSAPDARIRKIVDYLSSNNLLTKNSSVLDIGCGPGRFAVEFAMQSTDVIGLDISDKMLDYAVKNAEAANLTNTAFKNLNWDEVNLDDYGWRKKFDLVTAINSPGIHDLITLEKMIDAARATAFCPILWIVPTLFRTFFARRFLSLKRSDFTAIQCTAFLTSFG